MVQDLVGKIATCSICGKKKRIENQRIRVGQFDEDIYLECRDCAGVEALISCALTDSFELAKNQI